jgi:hypothetical protein
MSATDKEILDVLRERKLDVQLLESKQLEREAERAPLLQQLVDQDRVDEINGKRYATRHTATERKLREAEAAAAAARRELCEINAEWSAVGACAQRLRGQLRGLSDSRIEDGLATLRTFGDRTRMAFKSKTRQKRVGIMGDKVDTEVGNNLEIGDTLAAIKEAIDRLEVLKEQPRPSDLPAVIEEIVAPCRDRVRRLVGL